MEHPQRLEIRVFQGKHTWPLLEAVEADFGEGLSAYDRLSEDDETILLARPDIALLGESPTTSAVKYKKISESGEKYGEKYPRTAMKSGAKISVVYELVK